MQNHNVVITNVSLLSKSKDEKENMIYDITAQKKYKDGKENIIYGTMTNEAPIKSIIKRLYDSHQTLDTIIFIASEKVRIKEIPFNEEKISHLDFLQKQIENYCADSSYKVPDYFDVEIKNEPTMVEVSESVFNVYKKILDLSKDGKKDVNIFIESNGGIRYVLTMLLSLTKTLENYYPNIHISEITSMVYSTSNTADNATEIKNTKDVFDTAQLAGIAAEFVNYGRTKSLQRYVESSMTEISAEQKEDINLILRMLNKVGNDIQLCRTSDILNDFYGKDNIKITIDLFSKKYKDKNDASAIVTIFVHLVNIIIEELGKFIYVDYDEHIEPIEYLPKLINWCLEKSFIQQALTLCSERLPEYLFKTGKIQIDETLTKILDEEEKKNYERNYYFIAHLSTFIQKLKEPKYQKTKTNILNILNNTNINANNQIEKDIVSLLRNYKKLEEINEENLKRIFAESNVFTVSDLEEEISISNKIRTRLSFALMGYYVSDAGKLEIHPNLEKEDERIERILLGMIKIWHKHDKQEIMDNEKLRYDEILKELLNPSRAETFIDEYSKTQSEKFFIGTEIDEGHISTNMEKENLQEWLYLYSICKEQRNLSNHASAPNEDIGMTFDELKTVIKKIISL